MQRTSAAQREHGARVGTVLACPIKLRKKEKKKKQRPHLHAVEDAVETVAGHVAARGNQIRRPREQLAVQKLHLLLKLLQLFLWGETDKNSVSLCWSSLALVTLYRAAHGPFSAAAQARR